MSLTAVVERGHARRTDPETSRISASKTSARASQCERLLRAFMAHPEGLTDDAAATIAGLQLPGVCWWRRCSDLRDKQLIGWATDEFGRQVKVPGPNGSPVGVSVFNEMEK